MMVKIDKDKLDQVVQEANTSQSYRKLSVYSKPVAIVIRYLDITTPQFSKGGATNELLTAAVKQQHPKIWQELEGKVPETILKKTYLPGKIQVTDTKAWEQVMKETETKSGKMINVYNPRTVSVLRYLFATEPRFNLNKETVELIGSELARRYLGLWDKVSKL